MSYDVVKEKADFELKVWFFDGIPSEKGKVITFFYPLVYMMCKI
jgi:hypothetical protein